MDIEEIKYKAWDFKKILDAKKEAISLNGFNWYPYGTLDNFTILDRLLKGDNRHLLNLIGGRPTVDIGCADGDLAFFLESLGCKVHVIDYAPTNFNGLRGVKLLKEALSSSVKIHEFDLDAQFSLPGGGFSLVFFLGILYHLKNPFYALEALAKAADYCLISTRIAKFDRSLTGTDQRTNLSHIPVAYLLDEREANNDPTNYWIFSEAGLHRILHRTGWDISEYITMGNTVDSDPASTEGEESEFALRGAVSNVRNIEKKPSIRPSSLAAP